jgi:hypothetical protein
VTARSVSRCVRCSQTIDFQTSCRRYTRTYNDFAKASACVDEMLLLLLLAWYALVKSSEGLAHVDVDDSTGSPLEPVPTYYGGPAHGPVENAARKRVERQMSTLHPPTVWRDSMVCIC